MVVGLILRCLVEEENDVTEMHVALELRRLSGDSLSRSLDLDVEGLSTLRYSCDPLLNSRCFGLISKSQTKAIYHYENTTPTRLSGQSLIIMTLDFAFCNQFKSAAVINFDWNYIYMSTYFQHRIKRVGNYTKRQWFSGKICMHTFQNKTANRNTHDVIKVLKQI